MSPVCRHRTLIRAARQHGATEVSILHRGKHPALIGRTAAGRPFRLTFSDSPRAATQHDKLLLRRIARELGQGA